MKRKRPTKAAKVSGKGKAAPAKVQPRGGASGAKKTTEQVWREKAKAGMRNALEAWFGRQELHPEAEERLRKKVEDRLPKVLEEMAAAHANKTERRALMPPAPRALRQAVEAECAALASSIDQRNTAGLPAEDAVIRSSFASLMGRCAAEDIEGEIARHETKEVFLEMLDAIFQTAQKNSKLKGPAWAGRLLAEVLLALKKNSPILESNPAFAARYSKTQSYKFTPSAFWPWIERAYQRMHFVVDWDCGLHPLAQISSAEQGIPAVLDRIQGMGKDAAAREMFEKIIWPIIQSFESEIREETWFEQRAKNAKGARAEKRNANLSNLKEDFKDVWKVFFERPEGRLSRIERPD